MDENKITWSKCALTSLVVIIFIIIIVVIIVAFLFLNFISNVKTTFSRMYAKSIIDYCKDLPVVNYTTKLRRPIAYNKYDGSVSRALLEVSLKVTQSNCLNIVPIPYPPGYSDQYRIVSQDSKHEKNRMFSTVFLDWLDSKVQNMLIVFTGTFFKDEWLDDINFPLTDASQLNNYVVGVKVHRGFYQIYLSIRDQIWKMYNQYKNTIKDVYITGHSLGGALCTLAAYDFAAVNPVYYSFASPRVGNVEFAKQFNTMLPSAFRIYNIEDVITELPPPIILDNVYQHVDTGIPFNVNLGGIGANHVNAYLEYLPVCLPNVAPCVK